MDFEQDSIEFCNKQWWSKETILDILYKRNDGPKNASILVDKKIANNFDVPILATYGGLGITFTWSKTRTFVGFCCVAILPRILIAYIVRYTIFVFQSKYGSIQCQE
jgi:hypothetical protein